MKRIELQEKYIHGAVSLERTDGGIKPWRLPYDRIELFPPDGLNGRAEETSGIRLAFRSDTRSVRIRVAPLEAEAWFVCKTGGHAIPCKVESGGDEALFVGLPEGSKLITVYFPQNRKIVWRGLEIDEAAEAKPDRDERKRWITYGSSITQGCSLAVTPLPTETWPVVASWEMDVHLTNLGFGGNCHHETMVARQIGDLPADLVSLCFGINVMGGCTLSGRTFRPSVLGFVQTIRDRRRDVPIIVVSPIYSAAREQTANTVGLHLMKIREEIRQAVLTLNKHGDEALYVIDGTELLGESDADTMPDGLHPDARGYARMAERFAGKVRALGLLKAKTRRMQP